MGDEITTNSEIGYTGVPVQDIIDSSGWQKNEAIRSPAIMQLENVQWSQGNATAMFDAYLGISGGVVEYAGNKVDSKKATWQTVPRAAIPCIVPLQFGAFCWEDILASPQKYEQILTDLGRVTSAYVVNKAIASFGLAANKKAVDQSTKGISQANWNEALSAFDLWQNDESISAFVHPNVYAKIKTILGTFSVAGQNATVVTGQVRQFAGTTVYQCKGCDVTEGVYTSYFVLPNTYQFGFPAEMRIETKTERGKLEKYADASMMYVDYTAPPFGQGAEAVKRVIELKHLLDDPA